MATIQKFRKGSSLAGNSNFNNPSLVSLFENLRGGNFNNSLPPPPLINLFGNLEGGNPLPNNNNSPGGLDPNVAMLVNALTGINLTGGHYSREGNFIKPTKFEGTKTENPNEWLERFNRITEANQQTEYRRFQIIGGYLVRAAARWYDKIKACINRWAGFKAAFLQKFASSARKNT